MSWEEILMGWLCFLDYLVEFDLMYVMKFDRIIDGIDFLKVFGVKLGRWMGVVFEVVMEW